MRRLSIVYTEKNIDVESLYPTCWKQLYTHRKNNLDLGQLLSKITCEKLHKIVLCINLST